MKFWKMGLISSLLLTAIMSSRVEAFKFPNVKPDADAPSYLFLPNGPITFLKRGETTGGKYSLMETIVPPGGASPPHIHHEENEWLYIAEGNMQLVVGDSFYVDPSQIPGVTAPRDTLYAFDAPAGTLFFGRKNYLHGIRNVGTTTGKVLLITDPAGFENLIAEVAQSVPDLSNLPSYDPQTLYRFAGEAVNYGLVGSGAFEQFGDIVVEHNFAFPDNHSDELLALLSDDIAQVPEPTLVVGILIFGATGAISIRKRTSKADKKVA